LSYEIGTTIDVSLFVSDISDVFSVRIEVLSAGSEEGGRRVRTSEDVRERMSASERRKMRSFRGII
jgi:hypothetical protein